MPDPAPDLVRLDTQAQHFAGELAEVLQDLDDAGGLAALLAVMKPSAVERTAKALRTARAAIDEQPGTAGPPRGTRRG